MRITTSAEDDVVLAIVAAARKRIERGTELALITQTVEVKLDGSGAAYALELPMPPLQSVESITYVDPDGAEQMLDPSAYKRQHAPPSGPGLARRRGRAGRRRRTSARS